LKRNSIQSQQINIENEEDWAVLDRHAGERTPSAPASRYFEEESKKMKLFRESPPQFSAFDHDGFLCMLASL
jgi:hypothetical protein